MFLVSDSPLGAFDSIFIKRKLDVRNLIFVSTYESDNVDFKADIKICTNSNPSILLGLVDDFYFKYIRPYHTLGGPLDNGCYLANATNASKNSNDPITNNGTLTWYDEQYSANLPYGINQDPLEERSDNEEKFIRL